eukprot:gene26888-62668_t
MPRPAPLVCAGDLRPDRASTEGLLPPSAERGPSPGRPTPPPPAAPDQGGAADAWVVEDVGSPSGHDGTSQSGKDPAVPPTAPTPRSTPVTDVGMDVADGASGAPDPAAGHGGGGQSGSVVWEGRPGAARQRGAGSATGISAPSAASQHLPPGFTPGRSGRAGHVLAVEHRLRPTALPSLHSLLSRREVWDSPPRHPTEERDPPIQPESRVGTGAAGSGDAGGVRQCGADGAAAGPACRGAASGPAASASQPERRCAQCGRGGAELRRLNVAVAVATLRVARDPAAAAVVGALAVVT